MDWLTFSSTSLKALAWPVAAVIALFVLKRQIAAVFVGLGDRLATMKVPGFEATFTERVNKIEEKLPAPVAVELSTTLELKQDAEAAQDLHAAVDDAPDRLPADGLGRARLEHHSRIHTARCVYGFRTVCIC
jgi:hypothetical protein